MLDKNIFLRLIPVKLQRHVYIHNILKFPLVLHQHSKYFTVFPPGIVLCSISQNKLFVLF